MTIGRRSMLAGTTALVALPLLPVVATQGVDLEAWITRALADALLLREPGVGRPTGILARSNVLEHQLRQRYRVPAWMSS